MVATAREDTARGFTLLELLVSQLITLVVAISLFQLIDINQRVLHDQQDLAQMQQNARAGFEFIQRDLYAAGYGLVGEDTVESLGCVFPNADSSDSHVANAVTLWYDSDGPKGRLKQDMATAQAPIILDYVAGFTVGDDVVIIGPGGDGNIHFDWFSITSVSSDPGLNVTTLAHAIPANPLNLSTRYLEGAKVFYLNTVSYYVQANAEGVLELFRRYRREDPVVVADRIIDLTFRYYNDAIPPVELTGINTAAKRRAIRKIEISYEAETERASASTHARRRIALRSEVAPRNQLYKRNL